MSSKTFPEARQSDFLNVCSKCGIIDCCNGARPPLTSKRKKLIKSFLEANGGFVSNPFEDRKYAFPRETETGHCIFFDKTSAKCQVHPVKPETCAAGPITFDINIKTGKIEWFLKMEKICLLAGVLNQDKASLEKHMKSAKREILRLVGDLDPLALRTILAIEEPDTFKIDEDNLDLKVIAKLKRSI
jgi:Fe-S-cluster containining protein